MIQELYPKSSAVQIAADWWSIAFVGSAEGYFQLLRLESRLFASTQLRFLAISPWHYTHKVCRSKGPERKVFCSSFVGVVGWI